MNPLSLPLLWLATLLPLHTSWVNEDFQHDALGTTFLSLVPSGIFRWDTPGGLRRIDCLSGKEDEQSPERLQGAPGWDWLLYSSRPADLGDSRRALFSMHTDGTACHRLRGIAENFPNGLVPVPRTPYAMGEKDGKALLIDLRDDSTHLAADGVAQSAGGFLAAASLDGKRIALTYFSSRCSVVRLLSVPDLSALAERALDPALTPTGGHQRCRPLQLAAGKEAAYFHYAGNSAESDDAVYKIDFAPPYALAKAASLTSKGTFALYPEQDSLFRYEDRSSPFANYARLTLLPIGHGDPFPLSERACFDCPVGFVRGRLTFVEIDRADSLYRDTRLCDPMTGRCREIARSFATPAPLTADLSGVLSSRAEGELRIVSLRNVDTDETRDLGAVEEPAGFREFHSAGDGSAVLGLSYDRRRLFLFR